jgi:hypothetical protein
VIQEPTYFAPYCETLAVYGDDAFTGLPTGGNSSSESCPKVDITQNMYCQGRIPVTNVVFSGPADATKDPNGCAPSGDPNLFVCQTSGKVSIKADCTQTLPGDPACPPGYTLDGNKCVANGGPGECLPGFNYDPVNQCCTAQPGVGTSFDLPICPVGTYYLQGQNACVPYPAKGIVSIVKTIGFEDCSPRLPSGGKTPSACQPPINGCVYRFTTWNPKLCCCASSTGQCY